MTNSCQRRQKLIFLQMGATPDISIITVTYNGFQDTCELIESVQQYLGSSCELIVVDNASVRDEASLISKKYPWVITVRIKRTWVLGREQCRNKSK